MGMNAVRQRLWHAHVEDTDERDVAVASMPDVLYIMGTGRSGTTILEVLLTSGARIAGTGELKHIFRDGFLRNQRCACGQPSSECELWSSVRRTAGWSEEECRKLRGLIERLEGHAHFPLVFLGLTSRAKAAQYRKVGSVLFRSVAKLTGSSVVVDSSKYPGRALLLYRAYPGRVKIICITRSAAGLLAAFQKPNQDEQRPKSLSAAAAYYVYVLFCMWLVRIRLGAQCLTIRFEDLIKDPVEVLRKIEAWSGVSLAEAREKLVAGEPFAVGHIVTGNRLRKQGQVRFDPSSSTASTKKVRPSGFVARTLERYRSALGF